MMLSCSLSEKLTLTVGWESNLALLASSAADIMKEKIKDRENRKTMITVDEANSMQCTVTPHLNVDQTMSWRVCGACVCLGIWRVLWTADSF